MMSPSTTISDPQSSQKYRLSDDIVNLWVVVVVVLPVDELVQPWTFWIWDVEAPCLDVTPWEHNRPYWLVVICRLDRVSACLVDLVVRQEAMMTQGSQHVRTGVWVELLCIAALEDERIEAFPRMVMQVSVAIWDPDLMNEHAEVLKPEQDVPCEVHLVMVVVIIDVLLDQELVGAWVADWLLSKESVEDSHSANPIW